MDKYIGFDIDSKKTVACVVQKGKTCKARNKIAAGVSNTQYSPEFSFGHSSIEREEQCGITEVRIPYRSPWQNPFVERFIGTLRREMLNRVIVVNQSHLERLLREFIEEYYHAAQPHRSLNGDTPVLETKQPGISGPSKLVSIPVIGGLHRRYICVVA